AAEAGRQIAVVRRAAAIGLAAIVVPVSALALANGVAVSLPVAPLVAPVADFIAPLRSVNSYGLFAVMTTTRPEIVVEGSEDGESWRAYESRYKPVDPKRRPGFVAPHQPRLDWQMWFAALGTCDDSPWLQGLFQRIREG